MYVVYSLRLQFFLIVLFQHEREVEEKEVS